MLNRGDLGHGLEERDGHEQVLCSGGAAACHFRGDDDVTSSVGRSAGALLMEVELG